MYLTADAISYAKSGHIYAKAGAQVKIITEDDRVLIVEAADGTRFPVQRALVSEEKPLIKIQTVEKPKAPKPVRKRRK